MNMLNEINKIKSEYTHLCKRINLEKDRINLAKGQIEEIHQQINYETESKEKAQNDKELYEKTALFCSAFTEKSQDSISEIFNNIGTSGLKIFGGDKELEFSFDNGNNKNPSVNIEVKQPWEDDSDDELITDITEAEGGGMGDIVALTLRLAMIKLIKPEQKGPIFLDEICRYIAKDESIRATGSFIQEVAKKLDKQFIIITHSNELLDYADKIFIFEKKGNQTILAKEKINNEKAKN